MPARLVLVNGAPGSGKSTVARALAERASVGGAEALALALDVDQLKHALGGWENDPTASGLHARRLALALAAEQLRSGRDVFVGQYLARPEFVEALDALAQRCAASFHEYVLVVDAERLAARLRSRALRPTRAEHDVNNRLVGPADVPELIRSLEPLLAVRPRTVRIDANGALEETVAAIDATLR
ncbi:AAA family ATPase [uncultured Leifsonia sp.]|uniref:AAA family ATPase n=1 Tax=uncultured Leifsonia sp. TaxID=340359 RepID=UPI0025F39C61|nr:AAA family ATPase [uncultured Leifsonia sp.]